MDLVTTVLPWVKGKLYSPTEVQEMARDFYGPSAVPSCYVGAQNMVLVGRIEAGHRSWDIVEPMGDTPEAA